MSVLLNRIGETKVSNSGTLMVIVEYKNNCDMTVYFPEHNYYKNEVKYSSFIRGEVKSLYDKSVYGVGYMGEGKYISKIKGKVVPQYQVWQSMIQRGYDKKFHDRSPTYKDCTIAKEWHNYQNFAKWYDENYYKVEGETMHLDKDILVKGNKLYSPETCLFVPHKINYLFLKSKANRGELPIGVNLNKFKTEYPYNVRVSNNKGKVPTIGNFRTVEEAFHAYKINKEKLIKQIAEEYKPKIPLVLYNAMINYTVEIDD